MQISAGKSTESLARGREGLKPDQTYNLLSEGLKTLVLFILVIQKTDADQWLTWQSIYWQVFTEIYKHSHIRAVSY